MVGSSGVLELRERDLYGSCSSKMERSKSNSFSVSGEVLVEERATGGMDFAGVEGGPEATMTEVRAGVAGGGVSF